MTAPELFNRHEPSLYMSLYGSYERIGVLSLVTGVIASFGTFTLIRFGSELSVILTCLIVGVLLVILGVVLLSVSHRMCCSLKTNKSSECLNELQDVYDEGPPSYEVALMVKCDSLPGYQEATEAGTHVTPVKCI